MAIRVLVKCSDEYDGNTVGEEYDEYVSLDGEAEEAYRRAVLLRTPLEKEEALRRVLRRTEESLQEEDDEEEHRVSARFVQPVYSLLKSEEAESLLKEMLKNAQGDYSEIEGLIERCRGEYEGGDLEELAKDLAEELDLDDYNPEY